jgi:hypothetical protein
MRSWPVILGVPDIGVSVQAGTFAVIVRRRWRCLFNLSHREVTVLSMIAAISFSSVALRHATEIEEQS